jgi:hypothetical protein
MIRVAAFAVPLVLAACVIAPEPRPVAARLTPDALDVTLSDSRVCRAEKPAEGPWEGALTGCPPGWRYAIDLDGRTNPGRLLVEAVLSALTLEGVLAPLAEVQVTDAAGRATVFDSPP